MNDFTKELGPGAKASVSVTVTDDNTAQTMGSGSLPVFATPAAAALIEKAACTVLEPYLEEGITTVGTRLCIDHISASPVGSVITATAELTAIEGRKYIFAVYAQDEAGEIVHGTHERFSVKSESFLKKVNAAHSVSD